MRQIAGTAQLCYSRHEAAACTVCSRRRGARQARWKESQNGKMVYFSLQNMSTKELNLFINAFWGSFHYDLILSQCIIFLLSPPLSYSEITVASSTCDKLCLAITTVYLQTNLWSLASVSVWGSNLYMVSSYQSFLVQTSLPSTNERHLLVQGVKMPTHWQKAAAE